MSQPTDIRRGQVITTFGPGAIVATPSGESYMITSNSRWVYEQPGKFIIMEERLRRRLNVKELRFPPPIDEKRTKDNKSFRGKDAIKSVRFPAWHHCRYCSRMHWIGSFAEMAKCTCEHGRDEKKQGLIPVRFVAACLNGHIEDFPFQEWVHKGENPRNHELYYHTGTSGSLGGIVIRCNTCGVSRSMESALSKGVLTKTKGCSGLRPWLGLKNSNQSCSETLVGAQRGASNIYFPQVISSIYIPERDAAVSPKVKSFFQKQKGFFEMIMGNNPDDFNRFAELMIEQAKLDSETQAVLEYVKSELTRQETVQVSEEDFRFAEYDVLRTLAGVPDDDYSARQLSAQEYSSPVRDYFNKITLVEKLRETRVFAGFTRLKPEANSSLTETIRFANNSNEWLPADIIRGEGIFLDFSADRIAAWESNTDVRNRANVILRNYSDSIGAKSYFTDNSDPVLILLHTLAHLLISEISLQCGYGNSSLRERIYYSRQHKMTGILIYTASGDAEGSLGGLVRQGKPGRLEPIIASALEKARWCSSDPVCSSVGVQGPFGTNLAACHNCSILPETSCELFNNLLDRGLVVGTPERPELGFFQNI
ncbi:DUF1998 domain-containing protein [Pontibacter liquoris]|uniref:DUF1998 domain-containing protein n=1 Tax=Pontibacter liquoris TaxID=2905677 RepID=UPI001FA78AE2|nr:DUF1998 domain-containing protein [Pontibacter liquoris]